MKKLLLVRHAKATHQNGITDFERPLKESGIQDASVMAQRLHTHSIIPRLIISSPSLRTIATANIFSEHLGVAAVQTENDIYEASEETFISIINQLPDKHDFIAVVGHNPAVSQALYYLTGKFKDMSPAAVAYITFEADTWGTVSHEKGELIYFDEP